MWFAWLLAGLWLLTGSVPAAAVDFLQDVYPIFQQHCLNCHGPTADGGLRLDFQRFVEQGGHTGSPILGGNRDTNAILQRVTTQDAALRMPKDRPPLSADEIEQLRRWVDAGTPWTDPAAANTPPAENTGYEITWERLKPWDPRDWPNSRFERAEWWFWRFGTALIPILLWIGACDRAQQWVRANDPRIQPPRGAVWRWLAATPRSAYFTALLSLALVAAVVFYQQQARLADGQIGQLELRVSEFVRQLSPPPDYEAAAPRLVRPQHPPRLGGEYYRGNDERNERLFNGGFYRTCVIRAWLCDAEGHVLDWGDAVDPHTCAVRIEIEKSPGAAEGLFTPEIMQNSYAATVEPGLRVTDPAREIAPFQPDGDGRWQAILPINLHTATSSKATGQIYICRGKVPESGGRTQDAHYGAEYHIRLEDGRISADSELWLACLYRTGNVVPTPEGKIADDEWFSFRPIPEIIGPQTTDDPKLLGIDAYRDELVQDPSTRDDDSNDSK